MKYFEIEYLKLGKKDRLITQAASKIEAIKDFRDRPKGIFISAKEIPEPLEYKIKRIKEKINEKFITKNIPMLPYIATLRQMAVMLDAGIPINHTLENSIKTSDNQQIKTIFKDIANDIESGSDLSTSLKRYEKQVGQLSIAMVELGEKTGMLSESINKLADILQEIYDNRQKMKKATRYPLMTIVAMMIAFSVVITLVVPQFASIFASYKTTLPFPTRLLLWIEHSIKEYGIIIGVGALVIFFILSYLYKKNDKFHYLIDKIMLKIYIVGSVIYLSMIGRFIYIFDTLIKSGIPIIEAIDTALSVIENIYLKDRLSLIKSSITEGKSLSEGFKSTGQFETMILQMIEAGESSGAINMMLGKISTYYKNKYSNLIDNISTLIEPLLIAGIAGFVLLLALGIFLPMWSLADAVGG